MKKLILILFVSLQAIAQNVDHVLSLKLLREENGVELLGWKYKSGDDPAYSSITFDDRAWDTVRPNLSGSNIDPKIFNHIIWFRKTITIDSGLAGIPIFIQMHHYGASEIFIDGKRVAGLGTVSDRSKEEKVLYPDQSPLIISLKEKGSHLIAVRFSNHNGVFLKKMFRFPQMGFEMVIGLLDSRYFKDLNSYGVFTIGFLLILGALLTLCLLHFLIFLYYREGRSNLNYSLFTLGFAFFILMFELNIHSSNPYIIVFSGYYQWRFLTVIFILLLRLVYSIVYPETPKKMHRITQAISWSIIAILFLMPFLPETVIYLTIVISISSCCATMGFVMGFAKKNKHEGIKIVGFGFQFFLFFSGIFFIISNFGFFNFDPDSIKGLLVFCFLVVGVLSIPISMSIYLALSFARTTKQLKLKLKQVETLSAKTLQQEIEKKNLIERQKEDLEEQVKIRTAEVVQQKHVIETKQKEMLDSIKYASRIQRALITSETYIKRKLNDLNNK
jgi:two-component system NtrC family sensor kinase